jgi:translation initiation factor IF-3
LEVPHISKELLINEEIRDREVRVIGHDGSQLGIMTSRDALRLAAEKDLDLVKIAPQATPPVCRIMDYGKFRFEMAKKDKEAKKKQKVVEVKEIRMSLNIDEHDLETKINHAQQFVKSGNKVKVTVRFRGREMAHTELGGKLLERFADACAEIASLDKQPKLEGRSISLFLAPKPVSNKA